MNTRNTILQIKGLQEWITCTEGYGIHLTGERSNAYPFTDEEVKQIKEAWERQHSNTKLEPKPWIILNAKHKPKRHEQIRHTH